MWPTWPHIASAQKLELQLWAGHYFSYFYMFPFYGTYTGRFLKNPVKRELSRFMGQLTTMASSPQT